MKPKKLKQEQIEMVKRSNEKHNLFTFDMTKPYYYVIDHVFSDPKKHMLIYFDEEDGKLVWMEELKDEEHLNTPKVQKWIEDYHKKKKKDEKAKEKAKAEKKAEREKAKAEKAKSSPAPKTQKKKPGPKPKKADGTPRKKPGPKPKNKNTEASKSKTSNRTNKSASKDNGESEKVA